MPISGQGWEMHVVRWGQHRKGSWTRTYGSYVVTVDGHAQAGLQGFVVEAIGPGDNSTENNGLRVEAKRYPLTTHFLTYVSTGFSESTTVPGDPPLPAVRLLQTSARTGILIHPAHPPAKKLYLASVGCLNPTSALTHTQSVDFWDSRSRVIALIASLRQFQPAAFAQNVPTPISGAAVVIDGEPTQYLTN